MHISEKIVRILVLSVKLAIAGLALYYVLGKIETKDLKSHLTSLKYEYLGLAITCMLCSQILGSLRLRAYFASEGLLIGKQYSIFINWAASFFSLLLPGGIGGDGYLALHLNKNFKFPTFRAVRILLLTRANGLLFLNVFFFLAVINSNFVDVIPRHEKLVVGLFILQFPVYFFVTRRILKEKQSGFLLGSAYSLASQFLYVCAALLVFKSLDIHSNYADYLSLFLAASVAAFIPITPGGVGVREIIFLHGAQLIGIDAELAVASALAYFILFVLVSSIGVVFYFLIPKIEKNIKQV